jgi:DNA polymerase
MLVEWKSVDPVIKPAVASKAKPPSTPVTSAPSAKIPMGPPVESPWLTPAKNPQERIAVLSQLKVKVEACRLCHELACQRKQTVFGVGPVTTRFVMVGEAPGAEEDRIGDPFVGPAGQLLDKILIATGIPRDQVYILNTIKCRPPGNRVPSDSESENCRPFLEAQLEILQPDYIVCWGAVAVRAILGTTESIGRLRGRFHWYKKSKVLVTYHPSYLLRAPEAKKLTWEDMKTLMRELGTLKP